MECIASILNVDLHVSNAKNPLKQNGPHPTCDKGLKDLALLLSRMITDVNSNFFSMSQKILVCRVGYDTTIYDRYARQIDVIGCSFLNPQNHEVLTTAFFVSPEIKGTVSLGGTGLVIHPFDTPT